MLEPYVTAHTFIKVKCMDCGYVSTTQPYNSFNGTGCRKCAKRKMGEKFKTDNAEIYRRFEERDIEILEPYIGAHTKISMRGIECGHQWKSVPNSIFQGTGCPDCAKYGFNKSKPAILYYLSIPKSIRYLLQDWNY